MKKDIVGYAGAHARARVKRTGVCEQCGHRGRTEMALIHGHGAHADVEGQYAGRPFSLNPDDYRELCKSCHMLYDECTSHPCSPAQREALSRALMGRPRPDISAMFTGKRTTSSRLGWQRRRERYSSDEISAQAARGGRATAARRK